MIRFSLMINIFKKLINTISRRSFGRTIEYSLGRFRTVRSLRRFYLKNFDKSDFIYGNNRKFIKHLNSKEVIYNLMIKLSKNLIHLFINLRPLNMVI